ncbi:MAG: PaaI family thioesterase, partial [Chloroflexi bacterium]|nr:PaaI family thioesterase [Chloroflexota bacterium]
AELIGLHFALIKDGRSQCTLEVNGNLMNPHNVLHGGVVYSMADTGMGAALYSRLNEGEICATVEIKVAYFAAVSSGTLVCNTRVIHKSQAIAVMESEIENDGKLVAKAMGTYSIFKAKRE